MRQTFDETTTPAFGREHAPLIRQAMAEQGLDGFIVPHEDEHQNEYLPAANDRLAWATGFTGSAGAAVLFKDKAALFVDGRYTLQAKDQVDPASIAARAVAFAKAYSSPVALPQIAVRADGDPPLGAYSVGDDCLLRITSPQFPAPSGGGSVGYSGYWRIVQQSVQPQDDTQPERVVLTLGATPT